MAKKLNHIAARICMACALVSVSVSMSACAAPTWDGQGAYYNFNWRVSGNAAIAPVQVFDDGNKIYLQFPQGATLPAIFEEGPAGPILVAPTQQLPYFVVDRFSGRLQFRMGASIAYAQRDTAAAGAPQGVYTGAAAPVAVTGSAQAPVSRETYVAQTTAPPAAQAVVTPVSAVQPIAAYVPSAPAYASVGVPPAAMPYYTLLPTDQTVSQAFARWAAGTGWEVRWGSDAVARITGTTQVQGPLLHAVIAVVDGLKQAGYPINEQWDLPNQRVVIADGVGSDSLPGQVVDVPREVTRPVRHVAARRHRPTHLASHASAGAEKFAARSEPTRMAEPRPLAASQATPASTKTVTQSVASAPSVKRAAANETASVFDDPLSGKSNQSSRSAF